MQIVSESDKSVNLIKDYLSNLFSDTLYLISHIGANLQVRLAIRGHRAETAELSSSDHVCVPIRT